MTASGSESLGKTWASVAAGLPDGWELEGLRCASSGLDPAERSDDWIAVMVGPGGEERRHQASDPIAALRGLVESTPTTR